MTFGAAVLTELGNLRARLPELCGSVLATVDGMVVAHDSQGIEPEVLAALAAAHLALARRFAHAVNHGELRECVVECNGGYLTSYAAGPEMILTLVTTGDANLAMVHLEARRCVRRMVRLLDREPSAPTNPPLPAPVVPRIPAQAAPEGPAQTGPEIPAQAGPAGPLARRTPMAALRHIRGRGAR
ncbi:roadblock/LC7 domain-containing protein [Krasilnikovia sp. MM14-A1259]|uniref:roadblock/LC7 domain-containing protein n=1 Tax=Krasilnikovia sp. MM14-A1259 TaxID=3373539 RepID=UPI0038159865